MATPEEAKILENFHKKHPPLKDGKEIEVSQKSINEIIIEQEKAKEKYNVDMASVEAALTDFLQVKDPIVIKGEAIAWVRRPTMKEIKNLFPREMIEAIDAKATNIPKEKTEEWDKRMFQIMSDLIVIPKYTAEQWEEKTNSIFLRLFYEHLSNIVKVVSPEVEGF